MMNDQTFDQAYNKSIDLHRCGQTEEAFSAIERLLATAENDKQRQMCINERKNLRIALGLA